VNLKPAFVNLKPSLLTLELETVTLNHGFVILKPLSLEFLTLFFESQACRSESHTWHFEALTRLSVS
jgi:hypothetical protein